MLDRGGWCVDGDTYRTAIALALRLSLSTYFELDVGGEQRRVEDLRTLLNWLVRNLGPGPFAVHDIRCRRLAGRRKDLAECLATLAIKGVLRQHVLGEVFEVRPEYRWADGRVVREVPGGERVVMT